MRRFLIILATAFPLSAETTVTLLHFSDYHSHALPFYTDEGERGGIARAIGYLRQQKRGGALVFSGGDTVNKGAPAWSDKYQCAEWPWWNGIVDAMAFGNHDVDYGAEALAKCRKSTKYPILSANTPGFRPYVVLKSKGARIGVFAVAGADFARLVKGYTFRDPVAAARETVRTLREKERVDAVVLIGHQDVDDDYALARAVPGIDVIFGSHSHLKRDLVQIPDTKTTYISPSQYLTYISRVELIVDKGFVKSVRGGLIPVDASLPEDRVIAQRVARMQQELERDPQYSALFAPISTLPAPIGTEALGMRALDAMRAATNATVAISTKSSFRGPLAAGTLTMESLRGAMPYDNEIVVCAMSDAQLRNLLKVAGETSYVTAIEPASEHRVATTDYMAHVAYKDAFACDKKMTGLRVREELRVRLGEKVKGKK
ncbi:MAG TPA: metallophosphoesterase [Thermoanaerobaculia bacterium]